MEQAIDLNLLSLDQIKKYTERTHDSSGIDSAVWLIPEQGIVIHGYSNLSFEDINLYVETYESMRKEIDGDYILTHGVAKVKAVKVLKTIKSDGDRFRYYSVVEFAGAWDNNKTGIKKDEVPELFTEVNGKLRQASGYRNLQVSTPNFIIGENRTIHVTDMSNNVGNLINEIKQHHQVTS